MPFPAEQPPWRDPSAPPLFIRSAHAAWLFDMSHETFLEEVIDNDTVNWMIIGPYTMIPYSEIERLLRVAEGGR